MSKINQLLSKLVVNKANNDSRFIQCSTAVKKDAIRRETINGEDHIIVSSYTLPNDIVMNGGLYPADEIAKSFKTMERTLAPVEHPTDAGGDFISASDPYAINNFYAGAYNVNVTQENGRIHVEKHINIEQANKSEKGKALLARLNDIETNPEAEPIHTSTGIFLQIEVTDGVKTNSSGQQYEWIARNMLFDHDAILLSNTGAATPDQGVGMAVNKNGSKMVVNRVSIEDGNASNIGETELSHDEIRELLYFEIKKTTFGDAWIQRVYSASFIYQLDDALYNLAYIILDGEVSIVGEPIEVEKSEAFTPKHNHRGVEIMKEIMINALKAASVEVDGLNDEALLTAYNKLQADNAIAANAKPKVGDDDYVPTEEDKATDAVTNSVAALLKPLSDKIDAIETKQNEGSNSKRDELAEIVGNSDKYADLTVDDAKKLGVDTLEKMAANCGYAHGVPAIHNKEGNSVKTEMPA